MLSKIISVKLKEIKPIGNINWTEEQLNMKESIINDYNIDKGAISISSDYKICDGNHRYSILLEHYGGEHEILVKKRIYPQFIYVIFAVIIGTLLIPFYLIYTFLKKKVKKYLTE